MKHGNKNWDRRTPANLLVIFDVNVQRGIAYLNIVESGRDVHPIFDCPRWARDRMTVKQIRAEGFRLSYRIPERAVFHYTARWGMRFRWEPVKKGR